MSAEAPPSTPAPRPQCPRCGSVLPPITQGIQVLRCGGCGAALQVSVRPAEQAKAFTPPALPEAGARMARPRRRPMVEISGPRRAEVQVEPTLTVELSQTDIDAGSAPPPPTPVSPASIDVPWYAEDIERLPEVNVDLGQLALESFEPFPPLPVRPDGPPGVPPFHSRGK